MHQNDKSIQLTASISPHLVRIALPSSKSISNRALIINALAQNKGNLKRLSVARDTQTMIRLLDTDGPVWDVLDAGTTMRFLTAFAGVKGLEKTLTGTPRMCERPIGTLVDALNSLGADIRYQNRENYPPLTVHAFGGQKTDHLKVRGDISSQYISALLMIAPALPRGLRITLEGKISSKPYIDMTRAVMKHFGVDSDWISPHTLYVPHGSYIGSDYTIERDWSAASYWYSMVAMKEGLEVLLDDLTDDSIQGDRVIANHMNALGVSTEFRPEGALLSACGHESETEIDFSDCPDLAQTIAVVCAAKGITCRMTGLESLRIKETDRIAALQNELAKIGSELIGDGDIWVLKPGKLKPPAEAIQTYHDHRMAMSFAPLSRLFPLRMMDPAVVNKSYPGFWDDLSTAGIETDRFSE